MYVLIGTAGSGKSSYADKMHVTVVSTDEIRKELYQDEADQTDHEKVFHIAHKRAAEYLSAGFDVCFDATSTTKWARKVLLLKTRNMSGIRFRKVAILFMTPVEECKRRNAQRQRVVPEDVIDRQYRQLMRDAHTIPEQFDEVVVIE